MKRVLTPQIRDSIGRHRAGSVFLAVLHNLEEHHAIAAASAIAFDVFLSLVPLAALLGFGLFHLKQARILESPLGPITEWIPRGVGELVGHEFLRLSESSAAVLAPLSVFAFLWVTSSGASTAIYVFEAFVSATPRPWWKRRLIALGFVMGATLILALASLAALSIVALVGSRLGTALAALVWLGTILALVTWFLRVSVPRRTGRRFFPGALVTVALWVIFSALFSWYVVRISRFTTLYGNLTTVAVFLVWLWILAFALLAGGEVNHEIEAMSRESPSEP